MYEVSSGVEPLVLEFKSGLMVVSLSLFFLRHAFLLVGYSSGEAGFEWLDGLLGLGSGCGPLYLFVLADFISVNEAIGYGTGNDHAWCNFRWYLQADHRSVKVCT